MGNISIGFVIIYILFSSGALLSVDAVCSSSGCTLGSQLIGSAGCTNYQNYINCLTNEKSGCTSSVGDQATSSAIDIIISSNTALRQALQCRYKGRNSYLTLGEFYDNRPVHDNLTNCGKGGNETSVDSLVNTLAYGPFANRASFFGSRATGLTVSMATLVLSALAAFFKL